MFCRWLWPGKHQDLSFSFFQQVSQPVQPKHWTRFKQMVARICSLEMRRHLPNDARPDLSAYNMITELFPGEPLLPWLQHLVYLVPDLDEDLAWEPQLSLELGSLLTPSLVMFSFNAEEPSSDIILGSVASTCQEIRELTWKKPGFMTNLPQSLLRFSTLLSLDINYTRLTDENVGIISRLSSLTHFKVLFNVNWHQQKMAPLNNIHWILGNLEILNISSLNQDILGFNSCLNSSRLHTLVVSLMSEAPRPCSSICNIISLLKTLSLNFIVPNRPDNPIEIKVVGAFWACNHNHPADQVLLVDNGRHTRWASIGTVKKISTFEKFIHQVLSGWIKLG